MHNVLGYSVYLSTFEKQKALLEKHAQTNALVFLSLHISEEFSEDYCARAEEICRWLAKRKFRIIADVSTKTVKQFGEPDLVRLARRLSIWGLRMDYGFSTEEIIEMAKQMPIVLNASTTDAKEAEKIAQTGKLVMAMHNFYPRPETGLDEQFLMESTQSLKAAGLKVLAFIPGDMELRGPVYEGLPTLEMHRGCPPSICFMDLKLRFGIDGIFLGDPAVSTMEQERIQTFCENDLISIPSKLLPSYEHLYGKVFTNRVDSPQWLIRFQESREYSCFGSEVAPTETKVRHPGCITIDNCRYGRYAGEIQLVRAQLPADERVNVIGRVDEAAMLSAGLVGRGQKFRLVTAETTR